MRLFLGVFASLFLLSLPAAAQAPITPTQKSDVPQTCDNEFWDVLEARAWQEGKREYEFAQTLILKTDSVLEYGCFDDRLDLLNKKGASWSNRKADMKTATTDLIGEISIHVDKEKPANKYIEQNFDHAYLGGKYRGDTSCEVMKKIYKFARCNNFNKNDYMTFKELARTDPRKLPEPCQEPSRSTKWNEADKLANPPPATPAAKGGMDKMEALREKISGSCADSAPIPTGINIINPDGTTTEQKICIIPGCTASGDSCI